MIFVEVLVLSYFNHYTLVFSFHSGSNGAEVDPPSAGLADGWAFFSDCLKLN